MPYLTLKVVCMFFIMIKQNIQINESESLLAIIFNNLLVSDV